MCSKAAASAPAPLPRAIARSIVSFGIDASRAFSIAFCRARLAAGSPPPSRAATMIARASFEKSLPRRASATPFLCLIDDHLLCPDTGSHPHQPEEPLVDARVGGQLGVERGDEDSPVAQHDRLAVVLRKDLHARADLAHPRRADEDAPERLGIVLELQVGLEARDLGAVGVALDLDVDEIEVPPVEQDHSGARTQDCAPEPADRLLEPVEPDQTT